MTKRKPRKLPVPPSGFYAMARRNLEGVKRIVHTLASDTERNSDPCVQFLLGWSIEGFLKTFLAANNVSDDDLRNKVGHDLIEAYDWAAQRGLRYAGVGSLRGVVDDLAPSHLEMYWRYLPKGPSGAEMTFTFVWPSRAVPVLDALDEAVWPCVEAHFASLLVAQGKPLHPGWRPALG